MGGFALPGAQDSDAVGVQAPKVAGGPPLPPKTQPNVNPLSPATAPQGRPPSPPSGTFSGSTGASLPIAPAGTGAAGAGAARSFPNARPPMPNANMRQPGAPAPPPSPTTGATGGGPTVQTSTTATPMAYELDHIPDATERASLPPGATVRTPYGPMNADGTITPSPETAVQYQNAVVQARRAFGPHPWASDPGAPPPPVRLGGHSINPFTGQWKRH